MTTFFSWIKRIYIWHIVYIHMYIWSSLTACFILYILYIPVHLKFVLYFLISFSNYLIIPFYTYKLIYNLYNFCILASIYPTYQPLYAFIHRSTTCINFAVDPICRTDPICCYLNVHNWCRASTANAACKIYGHQRWFWSEAETVWRQSADGTGYGDVVHSRWVA